MKRTAMLLAILLALSASSCGGDAPAADTTAAPGADSTTPAVTEPAYQLPKADFGGREIRFFLGEERTRLHATEETGDTVNDAIYQRNRKVEELYNCKFDYTTMPCAPGTWSTWYSTLESSIMAGDNSVDIAGGYAYRFAALTVTSGMFQNLMDIPQINFDGAWWPGFVLDSARIGSKLFATYGNIDPMFYDLLYALIFNKEMAEDLNLDFYGLVDSGTWTFAKLQEVAKLATRDLDGNSTLDDKDQWGFVTGNNMSVDSFNNAFDLEFIEYDKDGMPKLLPLSEKVADACTMVKEFALKSQIAWYGLEADKQPIFNEGRGLIMTNSLKDIQTMRDLETDFGIIPYPKWDEKQENYYTRASLGNAAAYCIPITSDGEVCGTILEALAYYGYEDMIPVYYEKALKGKNTRDDESIEMLDLIFSNVKYGFCDVYSYAFGDQKAPTMLMRMILKKDKEIASTYEADKQLYEDTIASLIDALK